MSREETWLLNQKYNGIVTDAFTADCNRLNAGEPLAYLIGWVPFLNAKIYLDSRPLIPRPETEFLTEHVRTEIQKAQREKLDILDLCAGSGCIGVALLIDFADIQVDFAEIDEQHHSTIQKSIEMNGIDSKRTHIYGGDLFTSIPKKQYDYILANPPYIDPKVDRTEKSVRTFEPQIALYGGKSGTEVIIRILNEARSFLTPNGVLYIEHEPEQQEIITTCAVQNAYTAAFLTDQFGIVRYTRLTTTK